MKFVSNLSNLVSPPCHISYLALHGTPEKSTMYSLNHGLQSLVWCISDLVTRRRVFFSYNEPILDLKMQGQGLRLPFSYLGKPVTAWVNYYVWERPDEVARAKRTFEAC